MVDERRQDAAAPRRGGDREPEAQQQQAEEREDRGDVPGEREIEERAVPGERVERRAGERHRHAPLVERLVVLDPRRVAGVLRISRAQLGRERPLELAVDRLLVVDAAELEQPRLVEQRVRRPLDRVARTSGHTVRHGDRREGRGDEQERGRAVTITPPRAAGRARGGRPLSPARRRSRRSTTRSGSVTSALDLRAARSPACAVPQRRHHALRGLPERPGSRQVAAGRGRGGRSCRG